MVIVIPAYEPDLYLIRIVERLMFETNYAIVIVNDGSSADKDIIFERLRAYVDVVTHQRNMGKGAAIKTALSYIQKNMSYEDGVVFMDADGQHTIQDMQKVVSAFSYHSHALVLGSRKFQGRIPLKSLLGNKITKEIFQLLSGVSLSDTQTGLRAVSSRYIPMLLEIEGQRYEYEMNMLFTFAREKIGIVEVPIETIYVDEINSTSHFRVIRDSIRVYSVIFKFMTSSCICAILDYALFLLLNWIFIGFGYGGGVIISNIAARIISAITNYNLNKRCVFKNKEKDAGYSMKYIALAVSILMANTGILYVLTNLIHIPPAAAKIMTEVMLFFISFLVQQKFIFGRSNIDSIS